MRMFEKEVLRRMFGSKKEEVTDAWRKLHNEMLQDKYCLLDVNRVTTANRSDRLVVWQAWGRR
jgi:hypothetical protein